MKTNEQIEEQLIFDIYESLLLNLIKQIFPEGLPKGEEIEIIDQLIYEYVLNEDK